LVGGCSALCLLLLLRLQQLLLMVVKCSCCLRRCRRPQHRLQLQGQRQGPHCRILCQQPSQGCHARCGRGRAVGRRQLQPGRQGIKQGLRLSLSGPQDAQVDDVSVVSPALQRKRVPCRQDGQRSAGQTRWHRSEREESGARSSRSEAGVLSGWRHTVRKNMLTNGGGVGAA
jgi:hypothetical protein